MNKHSWLLNKAEQFIFHTPRALFCGVVWLLSLLKVGVWFIPNIGAYHAISLNPFANPFDNPDAHYLMWSWLAPWLAWLLHLRSLTQFMLLLSAFSVGFSLLFMVFVFRQFPDRIARTALILFTVLPVSAMAYFWVSMDSLTLFLLLIVLGFPALPSVTLLGGLALGMQHFEQAFVGVVGLLIATVLNRWVSVRTSYNVRFCLVLLSSIVMGKLLLFFLFQHYAIDVNSGRMYFLLRHFPEIFLSSCLHTQSIVWSVLGLGWLIALRYVDCGRQVIPFFIGLMCVSTVMIAAGDQARVLGVVTFPLVCAYWLFNRDFLSELPSQQVALVFLIWLVMPWFWFWGHVRGSALPYDIAYALHRTLGVIDLPNQLAMWPFA